MIFIVVKFETKPEWTDRWPDLVASFTAATRAEEGNLWFEWSRSLDNPAEYVLVEAFRDGDAGGAHVNSDHFKQAMQELPQALKSTPKIISQTIDATGWSAMGEMAVELIAYSMSTGRRRVDFVAQPIARRQRQRVTAPELARVEPVRSPSRWSSNPISS